MFLAFEIIGTIVFAIYGAMAGIQYQMDIFGVVTMGVTTAVGGGIVRDLILGKTPPTAFCNPVYVFLAIGISLFVFLPAIRSRIRENSFWLLLADSIGLGVFTVNGARMGLETDNLFLQVFLGTVTGVGGGILRDLFVARRPTIFVKHFYACAAITGALAFVLLYPLGQQLAMLVGMSLVVVLRLCAAKYHWNLPRA